MATMSSLNRDSYTGGSSEADKISVNVSAGLPLISSSPMNASSNMNVQAVEVNAAPPLAETKAVFATLPDVVSAGGDNSSNNYVLINLQDLQDKVWNDMGSPFLVLTNNEKGNVEAKVVYNASSVGLIKLPTSVANIQTPPVQTPRNVVVQSTQKTVSKPSPKTLLCMSTEQADSISKRETSTLHCLEPKQSKLSTNPLVENAPAALNVTPTADLNSGSVAPDAEVALTPTDGAKCFPTIGCKKSSPATPLGGQKSLECSFEGCGRKFSWPAHLKYHQMTHTGERQYACTSAGCLKTFYTSQRLAVHIRTHTGEKPFKCQEEGCEKAFTTAGNLKNHTRVHTGERPFVCNYAGCSRSFAEYSSLRKHKLVHTGEKPFVCEECRKSFSQSGSRTVHIKRHHGIGAKKEKGATGGEVVVTSGLIHRNNAVDLNKKSTNFFILRNSAVEDDDGILQYQDFSVGESVVFSQDMSDHVVTVTTQPPPPSTSSSCTAEVEERGVIGADQIVTVTSQSTSTAAIEENPDNKHSIDVSQEILSSEILPNDHNLSRVSLSSTSANVMVLSQPQEMVSLGVNTTSNTGTTYDTSHTTSSREADDIIYENDLLQNADPDQKEITTHLGANHILTISAASSLSQQQDLTSEGSASMLHSSKEVTLDPMMASDDEDDGLSIGIQHQ